MIQAMLALIAFTGYLLYQLIVKKKKIKELTNDILAICFFAGIWFAIYYWIKN